MTSNLVFDLGMHRAEDTAFYLAKGFRVVAVEADPELCVESQARFAPEIAAGRLTIVNKAIAASPGVVTLFKNSSKSIWNTIDPEFADRNRRIGADSYPVQVEATTLAALMLTHGTPYFIKIDIEGCDHIALESASQVEDRPRYISIESDKISLAAIRWELSQFGRMGYDRFKIVPQLGVQSQKPPKPALEGDYVSWRFPEGASGLFGEEAPGRWMTAEETIEAYRPIFFRYALTGEDSLVRNRWLRAGLKRIGFRAGWHDLHAAYGS